MRTKFDSNQQASIDTINAVGDIFDGLPLTAGRHDIRMEGIPETVVSNQLELDGEDRRFYNFAVEMGTGAGKTYIYLRTMFELERRYGFKKFIIVMPSAGTRDGMIMNTTLSKERLVKLLGVEPVPVSVFAYNPKLPAQLYGFAICSFMQILIMNIQAFNKKDIAVIYKPNDRKFCGYKPIEFIQHTCPIVLVDEPQNMETETSKAAIASLNPLCVLRYSATHH
jgi:type III restriction enzyme